MPPHAGPRLKPVALCVVAHAIATAIFWMWSIGVGMGLGARSRAAWTVLDHVQAAVVPPLALVLATPGRFFSDAVSGGAGLVLLWAANSLLWGVALAAAWAFVSRWRRGAARRQVASPWRAEAAQPPKGEAADR